MTAKNEVACRHSISRVSEWPTSLAKYCHTLQRKGRVEHQRARAQQGAMAIRLTSSVKSTTMVVSRPKRTLARAGTE